MATLEELLALLPDNNAGAIDADDLRTIVTELWNRDEALAEAKPGGGYEAGRFYAPPYANVSISGGGTGGLTPFMPFVPVSDVIIDGAGILAGSGPAGRTMAFGIYDSDSESGLPFTKLIESDPVDMSVAPNPAYKFVSGPLLQPIRLKGGRQYWVTGLQNTGGNFQTFTLPGGSTTGGVPPQGFLTMNLAGSTPAQVAEWQGSPAAGLPVTIPPANIAWSTWSSPAIWLRAGVQA